MSVIMPTRRTSARTRKKVVVFEPKETLRSQGTGRRRLLSSVKVKEQQQPADKTAKKTERDIRTVVRKRAAPLITKLIAQQATV